MQYSQYLWKLQTSANKSESFMIDGLLADPTRRQQTVAFRRISKIPYKVLDAPGMEDEFYANLLDWSSFNIISIVLDGIVYLVSLSTGQVKVATTESKSSSVSYGPINYQLAIGSKDGQLIVADSLRNQITHTLHSHLGTVTSIAWSSHNHLASGGYDGTLHIHDVRTKYMQASYENSSPICGLAWSPDGHYLASGWNNSIVRLWDIRRSIERPLYEFKRHASAIRALAWSPHQQHILLTGGGSADGSICIWDTERGELIGHIPTQSQVCKIIWSKDVNEFLSTHGYSTTSSGEENRIFVWNYRDLRKIGVLSGHSKRVLHAALSPNGRSLATGAGDETVRLWRVFPPQRSSVDSNNILYPCLSNIR